MSEGFCNSEVQKSSECHHCWKCEGIIWLYISSSQRQLLVFTLTSTIINNIQEGSCSGFMWSVNTLCCWCCGQSHYFMCLMQIHTSSSHFVCRPCRSFFDILIWFNSYLVFIIDVSDRWSLKTHHHSKWTLNSPYGVYSSFCRTLSLTLDLSLFLLVFIANYKRMCLSIHPSFSHHFFSFGW